MKLSGKVNASDEVWGNDCSLNGTPSYGIRRNCPVRAYMMKIRILGNLEMFRVGGRGEQR